MGKSAQIASREAQIAREAAQRKRLERDVADLAERVDVLDSLLADALRRLDERAEQDKLLMPVLDAALELCGLNPERGIAESMTVDPANMEHVMEQVDATQMQTLREAMARIVTWVLKHEPEQGG